MLNSRGYFLAFLVAVCGVLTGSLPAKQSITVKLVNGKTGHPIWWRGNPYVFVGPAIYENPVNLETAAKRTNFHGEVKVDVTGAVPPEVKVWVDFIHRDCRFQDPQQARVFTFGGSTMKTLPAYSIEQILNTGVVSDNFCSEKRAKPRPGVLVIYVIPATFMELWSS